LFQQFMEKGAGAAMSGFKPKGRGGE